MSNKLEEFKDDLNSGAKPPSPPYRVSAGKLDRNFRRCYPRDYEGSEKPYTVENSDGGWLLKMPYWPPPGGGIFVFGAIDGKLGWIATEACE